MEKDTIKLPVYAKMAQVILGLVALFYVLYIGKDIIVPLILALLLAILLNPVVNFLDNHKINRTVSILLAILAAFILLAALLFFVGSQLARFSDSLPQFKQKFTELSQQLLQWVSQTFNYPPDKVNEWVAKTRKEVMSQSNSVIGQTLGTISGMLGVFLLLPVYIFLFLYYKILLLTLIAYPELFSGIINRSRYCGGFRCGRFAYYRCSVCGGFGNYWGLAQHDSLHWRLDCYRLTHVGSHNYPKPDSCFMGISRLSGDSVCRQ
jgi:hypothetical protein